MKIRDDLAAMILTYNESPNIRRTLERLTWVRQVLVIDSFSTDDTRAICGEFPNVRIVQRAFTSFADQCNFGLSELGSAWVLSLDADYVLTDALVREVQSLDDSSAVDGFYIPFRYCIFGKPLRATLLPPRCSLYRRSHAHYENDGHAHQVKIDGKTDRLSNPIHHDDRKSLTRWLAAQSRYSEQEADKLLSTDTALLGRNDRIRLKMCIAPILVPVFCLLFHRGILDGWAGFYYALQRTLAEIVLSLRLIERRKLLATAERRVRH